MRRGRKIIYWTLGSALLFVGTAALGFFTLTGRLGAVEVDAIDLAEHPPFRTWDEHGEIYDATQFPYVVEIQGDSGAMLLIGVRHTSDLEDPQFDVLESRWKAFEPTVALNEGRSRYFRYASTRLGGINDAKFTYILARREGLPIYSLEPQYQDEVDALLEKWPAELVASYYSLRVIISEAGGNPQRAESSSANLIAKRTDADGLRGVISSASDLDRVWKEHLPDEPDWRTLNHLDEAELMRTIGDDSREVRGAHMVRALATLASRGERVVGVVGASHAIRYEPTLRSLIGRTEAGDE